MNACSLCGGERVPLTGTSGSTRMGLVCENCDLYPSMGERLTNPERMRAQSAAAAKVSEYQRRQR